MSDLFQAAKADGIQRADDHADAEWREQAFEAIQWCARMRITFTADDVWERLGESDASTHEPAALGPVFLRASKAGLIVKTGGQIPSRNHRRHRDLTVWRKKPVE